MSLYFIPDIHGRLDLLELLFYKLRMQGLDLSKDKVIFGGDMIDRGPDSHGVVNYVRALHTAHPDTVVVLAGNHEWLCINACTRGRMDDWDLWVNYNGGFKTLDSYPGERVSENHVQWMASLPLSHEEPGFFFSHAPVPPENKRGHMKGQPYSKEELTWTYGQPEHDFGRVHEGKIGVCGHIHALRRGVQEPRFYDHYIFADAGSGCHEDAPLVAIEVNTREVTYARPKELK